MQKILSPYKYLDYKLFLKDIIEENSEKRGYSTKISAAASIRTSYLSQVLKTKVHLTPEHAADLAEFWGFNNLESEYFLELVMLGRAGNNTLKQIVYRRLENIKVESENLSKRFSKSDISIYNQSLYYSSWVYSAIHILISIEGYQSLESISDRLLIKPNKVKEYLSSLEEMGLIKNEAQKWSLSKGSIHLPKNSSMTKVNHQNWRNKAVSNSALDSDGLHYTSVQTLSYDDFSKVKELILSLLDKTRSVIEPSKEEELVCMNIDWFRI